MLNKTDLYFLTIAESGNLNKASQELYVSQPSLSKYIQRLEAQLGTPLFDRSTAPMKLNEAGALYLRHLKETMEREQQLFDRLRELSQEVRGTLRLGLPPYFGQCYLPKILPVFTREFPNVTLDLHEGTGTAIEQMLLGQKIDVAILPHPVSSTELRSIPLLKERVLVAAKRKENAGSEVIKIRDGHPELLRNNPVIMPSPEQKLRAIVEECFRTHQIAPKVFTVSQNVTTVLSLAASGIGLGFVPNAGLETISAEILQRLEFYDLGEATQELTFAAVTRPDYTMPRYTKRFLEYMKE